MLFSYKKWDKICEKLSENYHCIRADQILEQTPNTNWIVLKHDIETNPLKALEIAKIENKYGIKATYYFQSYLIKNYEDLLLKISSLGHEIAYHYDVLDSNKGNFKEAIKDFEETINIFKSMKFDIKTICPHGNPLMIRNGWSSNKDFFRNKSVVNRFPEILDIVVQLPEIFKKDYIYISDAGYSWKKIANIQTNDMQNAGDEEIKKYSDFFILIASHNNIIISTHPHRWEKYIYKFYLNAFRFKILRLIAKIVSSVPFIKKFMSKFYYLAKKI